MRKSSVWLSLLLFLVGASSELGAQVSSGPEAVDLDLRYRYPLSVGAEYQSFSPLGDIGGVYKVFDISGTARMSLEDNPRIQPFVSAGALQYDNQDVAEPERWDHTHFYGLLGLGYSRRFSRNLEFGAEVAAGASQVVFPSLSPDGEAVGHQSIHLTSGARISLVPSYNLSIEIHPNIRWLYSLGELSDFDGFLLGIGFGANFRFGQDPDLAAAAIRSLRVEGSRIPPVFPSMQSYYSRNPMASINLVNTEKHAINDIEISFFQAGYMDSPTLCTTIPVLDPGERREVPVLAAFNQSVFQTEGITPLSGELTLKYVSRGVHVEQKQPVSYDLYDKTATTWDDDFKVAAFITPADSALRNYASYVRQAFKESTIPAVNQPLQTAIGLYEALGEIGCLYQADPQLPFTKAQDDVSIIDSVSLPRDTLKRATGDCDDLTVLYCSLLEAAGIESGYILVPGHIYAVFNTGVGVREYAAVNPDRGMTLSIDDTVWVPVEITLVGETGFYDAWRKGIEEWVGLKQNPELRVLVRTREAQSVYRPIGLREIDLGLQYGNMERVVASFNRELARLGKVSVEEQRIAAAESGLKEDYNRLGIACARYQLFNEAERAFQTALKTDPAYISAMVNLATLNFLEEDYRQALTGFEEAYTILREAGRTEGRNAAKILINISRAHYKLEQFDESRTFFTRASSIDPELSGRFAYLETASAGIGRASEKSDSPLFIGEDE